MNHIISLSVHRGRFTRSAQNSTPDGKVLRAVLWNGPVAKYDDSVLVVAESRDLNIFTALSGLTKAVKDWSSRTGNHFIEGVDSLAPCWPIPVPTIWPLSDQVLETSVSNPITHCGSHRGLLCRVRKHGDVFCTRVFDVLPLPKDEAEGLPVLEFSVWGHNVFQVAGQLEIMSKASLREQGIGQVVPSLDDSSLCWPVRFGENRFD